MSFAWPRKPDWDEVDFKTPMDAWQGSVEDRVSSANDPQGDLGRAISRAQIMPYLTPLLDWAEPLRVAMIQEPNGTIYATWSRTGETPRLDKTTDGGATWTTLIATLPAVPKTIRKLVSGTLLMVEETSTTTPGGSNPRTWRSTDDGATWAEVAAGLKFPPLNAQGICEGTDGSVLIAEYGNVGTFVYRIRHSADDGVTWTPVLATDGVEPQGDPGHIHSVTYDPVAQRHVAFSDRPINGTYGGPRIYTSADNGATWSLLGVSDGLYTPNFVAPMYFEDHIAWVSDNQINGWVGRITREDFYTGNLHATELVAQLDQKAAYGTFPVRDGVWLVCQSVEHINSPEQPNWVGSHASTVYVVDQEGTRVSGGIESYYALSPVGTPSAVKPTFPGYQYDTRDHDGICWVNMPVGLPRAYMATPVTQGWAPPITTIRTRAVPYLKRGARFETQRPAGDKSILDTSPATYVAVGPDTAVGTNAHLRLLDDGTVGLYSGSTQVALLPIGGLPLRITAAGGLAFTAAGMGIRAGSGSPEGVVAAPTGTLYLAYSGGGAGTTMYVKETGGSGSTGWVAK